MKGFLYYDTFNPSSSIIAVPFWLTGCRVWVIPQGL
jgi:hypothetical protein